MLNHLPKPLIMAHRGCSSHYPENTLAAFRAAIAAGAHMVELDVNLSRDRQLIVIHDESVDRTTDGSGPVCAHTATQLGRLDAGSWFDPRFAGERVPTLAQVLEALKGRIGVNIEIKPEAFEAHGPQDAVERQVWELVQAMGMQADVLVSSFEWQALERLRNLDAGIALGLLSDVPANDSLFHWYRRVRGFSWHPDYRVLTPSQVKTLHNMGAKVFPYAVDGKIDAAGMLAMGVDGLILDDPREVPADCQPTAGHPDAVEKN
ncbi:glycerophosphodiester phosphodiesterase family protein [uncultured Desulfosarcina sp.]|uniref:glycerophosphodiester phosphodiesterase n=1 Tax=uncultured Desulfosarcina sp. TaxID=218289 RepID=UPI0029C62823|nr:glycerophosphodiester phosphodiesterase family protein [uncultured Desulfosarcina sp.]